MANSMNEAPADERYWSEPEDVALPSSGVTVTLCRPTKAYLALLRSQWPQELRDKLDLLELSAARGTWTQAETTFLGEELRHLMEQAFIQGRLSTHPDLNTSINIVLDDRDTEFIVGYLIPPRPGETLRDPFEVAVARSAICSSARVN